MIISWNGVPITKYVIKNDFPEYIEQSIKGEGHFNFEVKPISFKYLKNDNVNIKRDDEIKIQLQGQPVFIGFVDQIEDEDTDTPEITVYPASLKLKDITIGDEKGLEDEKYQVFEVQNMHFRDIIKAVLNRVNNSIKWRFKADENTIPDQNQMSKKKFFGNILKKREKGGLLNLLINILGLENYQFRKDGDKYYFVEPDAGIFWKTWWKKASWVNFNIKIPPNTINLGVTKIKAGSWINWTIQIPPFDFNIPTIGAKYHVYRCLSGGIEKVSTKEFFPLWPFLDFKINLPGNKISPKSSSNISEGKIENFLDSKGYKDVDLKYMFDLDSQNTYCIVEAHKKYNDFWGNELLLSFETPFDYIYSGKWKNSKAIDIIRDIAIVTNRYFFIDENLYLWLIPRSWKKNIVQISRKNILEWKTRRYYEKIDSILLEKYEEDDGIEYSFGLKLRQSEYDAIQNFYKEAISGEIIERTFKILDPPSISFGDWISIGNILYGFVVEKKYNPIENIIEVRTEEYV